MTTVSNNEHIEYTDDAGLEPGLTILRGVLVTTGASGAVNTTLTSFKGGAITRSTTGRYLISLDRQYYKLVSYSFSIGNDKTLSAIESVQLYDLASNQDTQGAGTVTFSTLNGTPAEADAGRAIEVSITLALQKVNFA